jgi:hypothetical protein
MNLGDQIYWWCHGGGSIAKSGHFNWKHYCKVMQAKHEQFKNTDECIHLDTTYTPNLYESGCSIAEDSAGGSKKSSWLRVIAQWVTSKLRKNESA